MRSVEEQLAIVTDAAVTPEPVRTSITDALGLMSAEEVQASTPLPGFSQAAIDGYAVRAVDVGGERALSATGGSDRPATAHSLPVVGEVPAGSRQRIRLQRLSVRRFRQSRGRTPTRHPNRPATPPQPEPTPDCGRQDRCRSAAPQERRC